MHSDQEIFSLLEHGDERGLKALYEKCSARLITFSLAITNSQMESEDIVIETLTRLWMNRLPTTSYDHIINLWYRMVWQRSIDYLRRQKRFGFLSLFDDADFPEPTDEQIYVFDRAAEAAFEAKLQEKLESLPEDTKQALQSELDDLTAKQAAEQMGISPRKVYSLREIAKRILRKTMGKKK